MRMEEAGIILFYPRTVLRAAAAHHAQTARRHTASPCGVVMSAPPASAPAAASADRAAADAAYDLAPLKAPSLAGAPLALFAAVFANRGPLGRALAGHLTAKNGFKTLVSSPAPSEAPAGKGENLLGALADAPELPAAANADEVGGRPGLGLATSAEYRAAFAAGTTTPTAVAEHCLAAIEGELNDRLNCVVQCHRDDVLRQAAASDARWAAGAPLSPLDGVPICVKDEVDVAGYVTTGGLRRLVKGGEVAVADTPCVRGLRAAGCVVLGKSHMTEMGLAPSSGFCAAWGQCYNPYGYPRREPGGSSSGSAVAVAAGLCPIAVGCDGGGSIRIPAARVGVVGIKATFELDSLACADEHWNTCESICHVGPIACCAEDAALALHYMANAPPAEGALPAPPPDLQLPDVSSLRVGVFWPWFEDADKDVAAVCRASLASLEERGAELVPIIIHGLGDAAKAHAAIILGEGYDGKVATYGEAEWRRMIAFELGTDTKLKQLVNERMRDLKAPQSLGGATLYETAQRYRRRITNELARVLEDVDIIATPALPQPPTAVPGGSGRTNKLDAVADGQTMKYMTPANLSGHPAVSVPAGYVDRGKGKASARLPVNLQLIGRPRSERMLLQLTKLCEATAPEWEAPAVLADRAF